MSPAVNRIEAEIKKLPANEQAELLERLESMVYGEPEDDPAFVQTINRRVKEIEAGEAKGVPVEETYQKMRKRIEARRS